MSISITTLTETQRSELGRLFDEKSPILVEVRFPRMGTSPDWYLCDSLTDFDPIWDRLGSGVAVHLHRVWDLKNNSRAMKLQR